MMNNNAKIAPTCEILSAFASHRLAEEDIQRLDKDSHNFLAAKYNVMLKQETHVSVERNTEQQVHLVLPYYSGLEQCGVLALSDGDMNDVTGGEITIIVLAIVGLVLTGLVGSTIAGLTINESQKNK